MPRPDVELTGVSGSSKLYQFMGISDQQESRGVGVGVQAAVENSAAIGGEKELLATPENWVVGQAFPSRLRASRKYELRVRQTSCYCSMCRVGAYEDCIPAIKYNTLVGMVKNRSGKENPILESRSEDDPFVPPHTFVQF
ncbi:unnamed protein product [Pylaiella littoralis]